MKILFFQPFAMVHRMKSLSNSTLILRRFLSSRHRPKAVRLSYSIYRDGREDKIGGGNDSVTPVIIVPGLFGAKMNWNSLAKAISANTGRRVVTIDVRNHGDSEWSPDFSYDNMKDDILVLADQLKMPKLNIIGHSLGGRIAMNLALSEPNYVEKLIVVDVSPVRMSPDANNLLLIARKMKTIQFPSGIPLSQARKIADEQLTSVANSPAIRQFLITNIRESSDKTFQWRLNLDAIENGLPNIIRFSFPKTKFNGPAMFIAGGRSDYLKPDHHDEIKLMFPQATFHYIQDAGHWLHAEKPKEFLDLVCPLLAT